MIIGYELSSKPKDLNWIDREKNNTEQNNAKTKETNKLNKDSFINFYSKEWIPLKDYKFISSYIYCKIKYNLRKKYHLIVDNNRLRANNLNTTLLII